VLQKRSLTIAGHRTSLALEPEFWAVLEEDAARAGVSLGERLAAIDTARKDRSLASAVRVHCLEACRRPAR
jgi:predicted DNA-binding ribbon-helix-helix protein